MRPLYRRARREGIARVETRVASQNQRWRQLQEVIDARAELMNDPGIAGGSTGLLVRQVRFVKVFVPTTDVRKRLESGEVTLDELPDSDFIASKETMPVYEYAVDCGLLAEMRSIETQAAKELGQHIDRSESTSRIDFTALSDDELEAFRRR